MGGKKNYFGGKHRDCLLFDPSVLKVRPDPQRPEDQTIDEEMVWSIIQHGVEEPLIIARDGEELYVVAGRRRRLHAIEANKRRRGKDPILVPCVWARGDEADLAEKAIIENFHRKMPSAIGTAKAMQQLYDQGRDEERLRKIFGFKSVNSVRGYLALLDCAPAVQKWVEAGGSVVVANKLAKLPKAEQIETLNKMVAAGATKGERAQNAVKKKGEVEPKQRALSPRARERVREALASVAYTQKDETVILAGAVLDFVGGNAAALKQWPHLAELAAVAIAPPAKPEKQKRSHRRSAAPESSAQTAAV